MRWAISFPGRAGCKTKAIVWLFGYDVLNRLTTTTVYGLAAKTIGYSANGNITSKTGGGTYTYGQNGAGPHAVSAVSGARAATYSYDANGNMTSGAGRTINCVSHNKPSMINSAGTAVANASTPDSFIQATTVAGTT